MKILQKVGLLVLIVLLLDQVSKYLVRLYNPDYTFITHVSNSGAAFGLFQNFSLILGIIGVIVAIVFVYIIFRIPKGDTLALYSSGLFLSGTLGNVIDRLLFGAVTDFINLQVWPVFNIADTANVLGAIGLAYYLWKS